MIQVNITNNTSNQVTNSGQFPDVDTANAWIAQEQAVGSFGDPTTYAVTQTDITVQLASQAAIAKGLQCQQFGATVIAQVYAFNEANLTAGTLNPTLFTEMLADVGLANIERLLWNGSLATALILIQASTTLPTYFSSAQITAIESMIFFSGSGLI